MIRQLESKSFLFFFRDHLRSTLGITCGRGSFAVHFGDHLRSRDHLRLGIICGTVQLSSLCGVWRNAVSLWAKGMFCFVLFFFLPNSNLKRGIACRMVSFYHLPVDSFSFDRIVCSLGEPFRTKQPGYIFLRMIFFFIIWTHFVIHH